MEKGFWKRIFINTCKYFSVVIVLILIIYAFMAKDSIYQPTFSVFRSLMLFCFCLMFSVAKRILEVKKLNGIAKLILHYSLTFVAFLIFIYTPMVGDEKYRAALSSTTYKPLNVFVIVGLFTFVYAIAYSIYFAISSKKEKKKNVKSEYKSLYKDKLDR